MFHYKPLAPLLAPLLAACLLLALLPGCDAATIQIGDPGDGTRSLADAAETPGAWTWVPVEGAQCRDGSGTGFGLRLQEASQQLLIYLEGGGACFNETTCARNTERFGRAAFEVVVTGSRGTEGIFNTSREGNPAAGWHAAYVPYCTGDVHAGSATGVRVDGVDADGDGAPDAQQFVGHENFERYVALLAERFAGEVEHVLLAGSSAGGFGTLVNYETARAAFPSARVTLLNDSGPLVALGSGVLTPDLQKRWMNLWRLEDALSSEAMAAVQDGGGLTAIYGSLAKRFPGETFGLLSYLKDATIRDFYGQGQPSCSDPARCVSGVSYARALAAVRADAPAWGTYYAEGTGHTFLAAPRFYDTATRGTSPAAWTRALLRGNATDVAP